MNTTEMDTDFARGVRAELAAIGTRNSILQRHQRRSRAVTIGVGAIVLAGATTGAAIAVNNLPGTTTVVPLGDPVTITNTGTASIDLGPIPANATGVVLDLTCVNDSGLIGVSTIPPRGYEGDDATGGVFCSAGYKARIDNVLLPVDGRTSITVVAKPGSKWTATAQYATSTETEWEVNARGQTFGVANINGDPDLTATQATNGQWGYIVTRQRELWHKEFLNVYKSDGRTIIGQMATGIVLDPPTGPVETIVIDEFIDEFGGEERH